MPFTTNPYCALADVKAALGISSTQDDAWLTALIPMAQAYIDREVGYQFQTDGTVPSPATRLYSGNDAAQMYIDDCIQLVQVIETNYNLFVNGNGQWQNGSQTTSDITADVVLGPDNANPGYLIYRLSGLPFYRGRQNYKVLGVFGEPSIPAEISYACIRLVVHYYKKRETNYADVLSDNMGVKERYSKQVPQDVMEILLNYKRRLFLAR